MLKKIYKEDLHYKNLNYLKKKIKGNKSYNSKQRKVLINTAKIAKLNKKSKVLEIGCGFALFNNLFSNYIGVEINPKLIKFAKKIHKKKPNLICADATKIPITQKVDFIYSFAALEHIERPDLVFNEIDRILKKNGVVLLAPAWNCRKYTVQKLQFRNYKDLNISLKISKFLIPLQNNLLYRAALRFPFRVIDELMNLFKKKIKFRYSRLYPSYNLWGKYPSYTDDDAVVNMDAHSAIIHFISKGYKCVSHKNFIERFFCRGSFVTLIKL